MCRFIEAVIFGIGFAIIASESSLLMAFGIMLIALSVFGSMLAEIKKRSRKSSTITEMEGLMEMFKNLHSSLPVHSPDCEDYDEAEELDAEDAENEAEADKINEEAEKKNQPQN